jgi:pimeloyl-ACP methyl ester carboxylesterase
MAAYTKTSGTLSPSVEWKAQRVWAAPNQSVNVYDLNPPGAYPMPVIMAPGWVEVPQSHRKHAEYLAERGRRVILYDAPHGLRFEIRKDIGHRLQYQKCRTLVGVLHAMGVDNADIIARSEGAIWALRAMQAYPSLIRHTLLVNPAGLIGHDNWFYFFGRWLLDQKQTKFNEVGDPPPYAPVPMEEVVRRDPWRAFKALHEMVGTDMRDTLRAIALNGGGVGVITTDKDKLFPWRRMEKETEGFVDFFYAVGGSHTSYFSHIDAFAALMLESLRQLEGN